MLRGSNLFDTYLVTVSVYRVSSDQSSRPKPGMLNYCGKCDVRYTGGRPTGTWPPKCL